MLAYFTKESERACGLQIMTSLSTPYPFRYTNFRFFLDLALVVTRCRRPRQQKVAQVSVTSCWRLADQGRKNELLGDSCWPAYGLSHTDDPLRHCPMHYATLLFFSFFFFFFFF